MLDIVIPTLNEENYVGNLLECLCAQTNKNFTVYLSDGKSTDKTLEVAEEFKDRLNIKILECAERGVANQRNVGARAGDSEGILFLDADAKIAPNFIERFIKSTKGRFLTICWITADSNKPLDVLFSNIYNGILIDIATKFLPAGGGCGLFISRKLFEELNGFDEALKYWEDVDFIQRATKKGYKLKLLKNLKIRVSTRRLDAEGRINAIIQFFKGISHWFSKGTIPRGKDIYYPMDLNYAKLLKEKNVSKKDLRSFVLRYTNYLRAAKKSNKELIKKYSSVFTLKTLLHQLKLSLLENPIEK